MIINRFIKLFDASFRLFIIMIISPSIGRLVWSLNSQHEETGQFLFAEYLGYPIKFFLNFIWKYFIEIRLNNHIYLLIKLAQIPQIIHHALNIFKILFFQLLLWFRKSYKCTELCSCICGYILFPFTWHSIT